MKTNLVIFQEWGTTYFTFEEDPEPFGRVRDQNIIAMCKVRSLEQQVLFILMNILGYPQVDEVLFTTCNVFMHFFYLKEFTLFSPMDNRI